MHPIFQRVNLKNLASLRRKAGYAIRSIRIQTRLILLFLLLSLLPMVITGLYSFRQSSMAIRNKINTYSIQVVNQVCQNIRVQMNRMENDTIDVGFSEIVQHTLIHFDTLSDWQVLDAKYSMRTMMVNKFSFLHDISDVLLFTPRGGKIIAYGDENYKLNLKAGYQERFLTEIRARNGIPVWRALGWQDEDHLVNRVIDFENGLLVGRAIKSLYEGEYIGAVLIRTDEKFFSQIYQDIDMGRGGEIFILDGRGTVVSSRTAALPFKKPYPERSLIAALHAAERRGRNTFSLKIGEQPHLVAFSPIQNAGWYVVTTIPYSYLNYESGRIRNGIMLLGIGCFLLAVIFTRSISGPLNKLIHAMTEVKKGNLGVAVADENRDEIAEVTRDFNAMVTEIRNLLADIQQTEAQKRTAELKALQAQINPHFISNVLNTAKLMANAQKAGNIESLLTSLIQLLQVSMGKEDDFITVGRELEYLRNYLNLQEFRYYDKFQVDLAIEPALLEHKLPKFLLQPILENAIIHGIGPKKGPGVIQVKGFSFAERMIFTITDDGIGMTQEMIARVLSEENVSGNHFCAIGIKNVQERIRLYFGNDYGLRIESCPNLFTTVEVSLPLDGKEA
jgi:two-component system sensor histidine kinase YesM